MDPLQILEWFVLRWRLEVTWQEARAHLGMETQRQWNAQAIARTTPALLGLFSMITLWADQLAREHALPIRQAVWYRKRPAHLRGCDRRGAPALVDLDPCLHVTRDTRHGGNSQRTAEPLD